MKDKKIIFAVLAFAVVASLLTLVVRSRASLKYREGSSLLSGNMMMPFFGGNDRAENFESMMVEPMMDSEEAMPMIEPAMGSLTKVSPIVGGGFIPPFYGDDALDVEDRVYQKTSYHSVVVKDVSEYLRGLKEYVLSVDGIVLNSSISSGEKYNSGSLNIRVPVEKFDEATGRVTEKVEKVVEESIDASDVTGQLVNTTESLQALQDAKLLKEAALEDAKTAVEKRRYQIEIERLERQVVAAQKGLDRVEQKVEYSTIRVVAADSERYYNPNAEISVREEFLRAWTSLKLALKFVANFGVWVVVYSVIWLPVIWIFKKVMGKK